MTLLGSCVAVCLWDQRLRMGGMTHSMLPRSIDRDSGAGGQGADAHIDELVQRMIAAGSRTEDMSAKLFGGFMALPALRSGPGIGAANIESAFEALRHWEIEVVAQEIMGEGGIVIYQNTESGEVNGRMISPLRHDADP
jgi:chemotaxis protein CheD